MNTNERKPKRTKPNAGRQEGEKRSECFSFSFGRRRRGSGTQGHPDQQHPQRERNKQRGSPQDRTGRVPLSSTSFRRWGVRRCRPTSPPGQKPGQSHGDSMHVLETVGQRMLGNSTAALHRCTPNSTGRVLSLRDIALPVWLSFLHDRLPPWAAR